MFVPDLLHEIELGTWKAIFSHLVRILGAHGQGLIQTLNKRLVCLFSYTTLANLVCSYRQTPTFGRGTIRKFSTNASEMKKLAARDFEDLLQVRFTSFHGSKH